MTLIALIIFGFILLAAFIAGVAIGRTGRDQLRLELANLRGRHETLSGAYLDMKRIAGEALETARERHFPKESRYGTTEVPIPPIKTDTIRGTRTDMSTDFDFQSVAPDYVAPIDKNCPECSVSVRSDSWPQECPACHSVFGFDE